MKRTYYTTLALCSALLFFAGNASATSFANNITIYDGEGYYGTGQGYEDSETEPGMVNQQVWDLEGFFQNNNELSMVGGYNFKDGYGGFQSGDIFISTDEFYGNDGSFTSTVEGNQTVANNFGYEYVFDLDFLSMTYDVLKLSPNDETVTAWYPANENDEPGSNPWRYSAGGDLVTSGTFSFQSGLSLEEIAETNFDGDSHYAVTGLDLSFLGNNQVFYSHFTMGCGNDNLMGNGTTAPVPEPATMILFGTGLAGLTGYARKRKK